MVVLGTTDCCCLSQRSALGAQQPRLEPRLDDAPKLQLRPPNQAPVLVAALPLCAPGARDRHVRVERGGYRHRLFGGAALALFVVRLRLAQRLGVRLLQGGNLRGAALLALGEHVGPKGGGLSSKARRFRRKIRRVWRRERGCDDDARLGLVDADIFQQEREQVQAQSPQRLLRRQHGVGPLHLAISITETMQLVGSGVAWAQVGAMERQCCGARAARVPVPLTRIRGRGGHSRPSGRPASAAACVVGHITARLKTGFSRGERALGHRALLVASDRRRLRPASHPVENPRPRTAPNAAARNSMHSHGGHYRLIT
mmetsp:Transcript_23483/g.81779  ORF Transcript_23483/g.81779 Transcript_23483/m.81779 type:complete len:314 (-) Transcript_23483:53-994(-)